jgi:hypothetical protein
MSANRRPSTETDLQAHPVLMRHLLKDLAEIEAIASSVASFNPLAMAERLERFRDELITHCLCEEEGVYLLQVSERGQRLLDTLCNLFGQHRQLQAGLEALITATKEMSKTTQLDETIRKRIREWAAELRNHEFAENLVSEACSGSRRAAG